MTPASDSNVPPSNPLAAAIVLDADYYLRNFLLILDTVLARDAHLFSGEELELFSRLKSLDEPALRLYVRLFNRVGPCFRLDKLTYLEIPDLDRAAACLQTQGFAWIYRSEDDDLEVLEGRQLPGALSPSLALPAYTVQELAGVARAHSLPTGVRPVLLQVLDTLEPTRLLRALLRVGGLIRLVHRPLLERIQRLFFLNGTQDASTLVTADLALFRYPRYRIWRTRPVFLSRSEFEAWLEAQALRDRFDIAVADGDAATAHWLGHEALAAFLGSDPAPEGFLERYSARAVHAKTALRFVGWIEPAVDREQAAQLYAQLLEGGLPLRHRGEAWVRLALHRERSQGPEAALAVCAAALAEPSTRRGERLALLKRQDTLLRRQETQRKRQDARGRTLRSSVKNSPPPDGTGPREAEAESPRALDAGPAREVVVRRPLLSSGLHRRAQFSDHTGQPLTVEEVALEAYRALGIEGMYTENTFFTTLLGILCWDIFFADVPDVFQSPFQDAPLDLYTDAFYSSRRELIEARLRELRTGDLCRLFDHHREHYGCMARGVAWELYPLEVLALWATRLGGIRLAAIVGHLLEDYRLRRRGLPDLLLWRGNGAGSGQEDAFWAERYLPPADLWFAEVKSPRDRLSAEQRAWMGALRELGMVVEVCRVEPGGE